MLGSRWRASALLTLALASVGDASSDRPVLDSLASTPGAEALVTGVAPVAPSHTLALPGLGAPVRVVTDRFGIPHLRARDAHDLYFAWGFVTARDRLWQLEHARRSARGELWRWFGNRSLTTDGGAQLFELRTRAHRLWERERAIPEVREPLERYAAGINAYLALCRRGEQKWPDELVRLRRKPADWDPEDSYLMLLSLGIVLDLTLPELAEGDSVRRHGLAWVEARQRFEGETMTTTIPDSAAERLYGRARRPSLPGRPFPDATTTGARVDPGASDPGLMASARRALGDWLAPIDPDQRASNVFAVGPRRAARGRPLLANDPHLSLSAPSPFHVIHLSTEGGWDAVGASVPGLPAIVSGRNRAVAWGITALSADVVDVYADTLSRDRHSVKYEGAWVPVRVEPFALRFRALRVLSLPPIGRSRRYTPHGPVVAWDKKRGVAYAVRWAGRDEDITLRRLIGLERSASAAEVAGRFRTLVTPTMNLAAADTAGAVVYQAAGAVPIRGFDPPPGPIPGDGRHEWLGTIAPDSMPHWEAPPRGFVVNSNNLPIGSPYPVALPRYDWPHDRAIRIQSRIASDPSVTIDDLRSIQNDVFSRAAERLVPRLVAAADSVGSTLSPRARAALDTLRAWDFIARRTRVAPTIFRAWYGAFVSRSRIAGLPGLAVAALDGRAPAALRVPGGERPEPAGVAAAAALEDAIRRMEKILGPDLSRWQWRYAHRARFAHALAWKDPAFEPRSVGVDGDNSTPCVSGSRLPWDTRVTFAPVWRHLVDLADPDVSWGVIPPGNSGAGRHRSDLVERWTNHGDVPLHLDWGGIDSLSDGELLLKPSPAR